MIGTEARYSNKRAPAALRQRPQRRCILKTLALLGRALRAGGRLIAPSPPDQGVQYVAERYV